jgi:triosephosphate isomerase
MTLKSLGVLVAAQDCSMHSKGAFTGEIAAGQLASLGVQACVLGHSERRQYHQETDEKVALKVKQCLDAGLLPIYCCGEVLEEREAGRQNEVVKKQLLTALGGLSDDEMRKVVVAYEPVWAIGTGKTASNEQAQEMHEFIRAVLADAFDDNTAMSVSILYGGSMNPANAAGLIACPDVDGGLIGGASLKVDDFLAIQQSV